MSVSRKHCPEVGHLEDAWAPAMVHILTCSVDRNNQRFKEEVPGTPTLGHVRGLRSHVRLHSECRAGRPLSVNTILLKYGRRATFRQKWGVMGERQLDVPCRSPSYWNSYIESICRTRRRDLEQETGMDSTQMATLAVHPVTSESLPART